LAEFAFQHTVRSPVRFAGIGVHTGEQARVTLLPAPADTGVVFIRTDVRDRDNRIAVSGEAVCRTQLGTVITNAAGVTVSTIEHLMAALVMTGVDNALVEIDGPEMPIMDGSSIDFIRGLDRAGLQPQGAPRRFIEIVDVVEVIEGDKRATLRPSEGFEVAFEIAFASAAIGRQAVDLKMDAGAFRRELADCRTFGFLHEVEALRAMGLARGGSMDNAVVIKALDAIGDLYVLGAPVIGRFEGVLAGHALNNAVVRALLATPHAWRVRTLAEEMAEAV
jgi:UDP-3-O-[3-hydroxymyristoyl] N-acetylglucosamine deacetylase